MRYPVITVDGPSGAGKGTLCQRLASQLGYQLLDSGALYRIVGLKAFEAGLLPLTDDKSLDEEAIATLTQNLDIKFTIDELTSEQLSEISIVVDNKNIAKDIRNETVGGYASKVAALPKVRATLLDLQKNMATQAGLIADGRDMGTVVFPDADAKIFLTASAKARAERRVKQLEQSGQVADYATVLKNIEDRDARDENRAISPSKPADDALVIDSSNMDADDVFNKVKAFCQSQGIFFS